MKKISLVRDTSNAPIQAVSVTGTPVNITLTGTSQRSALPTGLVNGEICRMASTIDCFFKFGDDTVVAAAGDSSLFTAGVEYMKVPPGITHIAVIWYAEAGDFSIQEID